jgi:hypothetical protein
VQVGTLQVQSPDTRDARVRPVACGGPATRSMFERAGFSYQRQKGKNHCIMRTVIGPG